MLEKNFQITPNEFYTTNTQSTLKDVLEKARQRPELQSIVTQELF